jgi:hypothetical protein
MIRVRESWFSNGACPTAVTVKSIHLSYRPYTWPEKPRTRAKIFTQDGWTMGGGSKAGPAEYEVGLLTINYITTFGELA